MNQDDLKNLLYEEDMLASIWDIDNDCASSIIVHNSSLSWDYQISIILLELEQNPTTLYKTNKGRLPLAEYMRKI